MSNPWTWAKCTRARCIFFGVKQYAAVSCAACGKRLRGAVIKLKLVSE